MPDPGYLKREMREAGYKLALAVSAEEQDPWKMEHMWKRYNDLSAQCKVYIPCWFQRFKDGVSELSEDDEKAEDQRCRQLQNRGW